MAVLRWLLALIVALVVGVPLSLVLWPLGLLQRHVFLTMLLVVPSSRFRGMFAVWIAHSLDGHCWRCGAGRPTSNDLRGKGLP